MCEVIGFQYSAWNSSPSAIYTYRIPAFSRLLGGLSKLLMYLMRDLKTGGIVFDCGWMTVLIKLNIELCGGDAQVGHVREYDFLSSS